MAISDGNKGIMKKLKEHLSVIMAIFHFISLYEKLKEINGKTAMEQFIIISKTGTGSY